MEGVALADPFLGVHGAVHGPLVRSLKESELASWFPQLCVLIITLTYANLRAGRAQRAAPETGKLKILPPPPHGWKATERALDVPHLCFLGFSAGRGKAELRKQTERKLGRNNGGTVC